MKLRNKLVAVLAASMVVTSVPVVTMADSTNYISASRYAQKDATYGYAMGSYAGYDLVYGDPTLGFGGSDVLGGFDFNCSNGFEFSPINDYKQLGTAYFSLTKDSEFNTKAMLAYVDAFNSKTGKSYIAFGKDGVVSNANNPAYNGQKVDDIIKKGVTLYYRAVNTDRVAVNNASQVAAPTGSVVSISTKVADVFKAKVIAAGSTLYTADNDFDVVLKKVQDQIEAEISNGEAVSAATMKAKAVAIVNTVKDKDGKIETTSYNQLYKSSNTGRTINADKLVEIVTDTMTEVATWARSQAFATTSYEDAIKAGANAEITIQKVDMINFKDADDREYESHMKVTTKGDFFKGVTYKVPVLAKLGGDKVVLLNVNGKDSNITSGKYPITQDALTDKRLTVEAGSEKVRTNNADKIGEIKFRESQIKSLVSNGNRKIKITLDSSSDLEFNISKTMANAKAKADKGFFGDYADNETKPANNVQIKTDADREEEGSLTNGLRIGYDLSSRRNNANDYDKRTLIVELPKWENATSVGEIVLSDIYVQPVDETAAVGDVYATIAEYIPTGKTSTKLVESTRLKVAEVKEYDVTLTCDKPVDIKAGRSGIVNEKQTTFVLEEAIKDSLVDGRKIKFTVENGYIFGPADVDFDTNKNQNQNNYYATGIYGTASYKQLALDRFIKLMDEEKIKFEEKAGKDGDTEGIDKSSISLDIDAEGRVIGFSAEYPRLKDTEADKIKVTMPIATDVMSKGEVKVKAENLYTRSFQDKKDDPSCVVANVIEPIAVTFDGAKLKTGLQNQAAGTITIKETDKGMIENGYLCLTPQDVDGIKFANIPTVTVEGTDGKKINVKNVGLSTDKTTVYLEVTKESTEACTIKVSDINFTTDRTVPEANYDLAIWGTAITDENELGFANFTQNALFNRSYLNQITDLYTVEDFIQMTTKNTEDIGTAAKQITTKFVIGENKFTVNGETVKMDDAKAYIKNGNTFVPVRYLAQAFGIAGNQVQYDKATSTATIISGDKVINITNGKAAMTVNGTPVPMIAKAEVVEGRMCVPIAYIASALGLDKTWDSATKTATFTNVSTAK